MDNTFTNYCYIELHVTLTYCRIKLHVVPIVKLDEAQIKNVATEKAQENRSHTKAAAREMENTFMHPKNFLHSNFRLSQMPKKFNTQTMGASSGASSV